MSTDNPQDWDLRVRDRNVVAGKIGEKDVAKYLSALPDLADQVETFATPQPALDAPELDDVDDEDEDDVDDSDDSAAADDASSSTEG